KLTNKYIHGVRFLIKKPAFGWAGLVLTIAIGVVLMAKTPRSFIPTEDDSFVTYALQMPPGASLSRTTQVLRKADSIMQKRTDIAGMTTVSGFNPIDGGV